MKSYRGVLVLVVSLLFVRALPVFSQSGFAGLSGRVTDPGHLAVAGAKVAAINNGTNVANQTETNDAGVYEFPSLPPGTYRITVEKDGFQGVVRPDVVLHVADSLSIDFSLEVGAVAQTVTVEGGAPLVNTTSSSLGGLVESHEIADLPLNGRNYINLTLMQPGITSNPNMSTTASFYGVWFSSDGATIRSNNFTIDGAIMQDLINGSTASTSGRTLGLDGIQEYRVLTNSYSAEYGLTMGSQTVMVSKGGTNQFHGSGFEYLRNSVMDAANFFDAPTAGNGFRRLPEYQRNNFGGSFGGPIRKDKTFFFATYERVRENLGITNTETVPAAGCHGAAGTTIQPANCTQISAPTTISAVSAPLLALYSIPDLPNNVASEPFVAPDADNFGQIRIDQIFSTKDSLFGRYTVDADLNSAGIFYPNFFSLQRTSRKQWVTLSETHIFSPSVLNNFRVSFSRTAAERVSPTSLSGAQYSFVPGQPIGQITVGGITLLGPTNSTPSIGTQNVVTFGDDVNYTHGRHSFKFGTSINIYRQYELNGSNTRGTLAFSDVAHLLAGNPSNYTSVSPGGLVDRTWLFNTYGFYAQDDWRVRPNLTLNLGLRYEPQTEITVGYGKSSALINPLTDTSFTLGPLFRNPSKRNFSPRLGFAWDVFGNGKTAVRGGASIMYDIADYASTLLSFLGANPPFSFTSTVTNPAPGTFTLPFSYAAATLNNSGDTMQYNLNQPYLMTQNLAVEQQLPGAMVLSVSYAHSRGVHLLTNSDANSNVAAIQSNGLPMWPVSGATRYNTHFGTVLEQTSNASSTYNALELVLTKRLTKGLQFQSAFTWSSFIDTNANEGGGDCTTSTQFQPNPYNINYSRGPACYSLPKNWVVNFLYNLPNPKFQGRVLETLASGWSTSGILTVHSGFPFTVVETAERSGSGVAGNSAPFTSVDRPDLIAGRTPSSVTSGTSSGCGSGKTLIPAGTPLGTPTLYFDPCAFSLQTPGTLGDSPRDGFRGPGLTTFDLSAVKKTRLPFLGEAGSLEFRADFFNIFNHPNFGMPVLSVAAGTITDPAGPVGTAEQPISSAGQITNTATTSRQIQLSLRLAF